jgi:hypothetical protein
MARSIVARLLPGEIGDHLTGVRGKPNHFTRMCFLLSA